MGTQWSQSGARFALALALLTGAAALDAPARAEIGGRKPALAAAFAYPGDKPSRLATTPNLAAIRSRAKGPVVKTGLKGFSFFLPGALLDGTGQGSPDDVVHAPWMRFPLEEGPAYVNSQVWGFGGLLGHGGGECDQRNYAYPWRDNFCESRAWISGACPGGLGHQGVDIRPSSCRNNEHWSVAAESGVITHVGDYAVILQGDSGIEYRYLHVNTNTAAARPGQRVDAGDRIALISNMFGGTPTTIHLHFEMRRKDENGELRLLSPYSSLIPAYIRHLARDETEAAAVLMDIGGPPDFASFSDCPDCPSMVAMPAGEAVMGSPPSERQRKRNEGPQQRVSLKRFAIGRTEVTLGQWEACVADGYCRPADDTMIWNSAAQPVTGISRADITGEGRPEKGFLAWMNDKAAAAGARKARYRLPSEAEWEYAARGGRYSPFHTGADILPQEANYDARFVKAVPVSLRQRRGPSEAGSLPPNPWGVYEMAGNVWEWTADCYASSLNGAPGDGAPRERPGCLDGVVRGGSLFTYADELRSARRRPQPISHAEQDIGFRLARDLDD